MIRNVLSHIGGVEMYGILSIVLFFAVFLGTLLWAARLPRKDLEAMGRLPLHDDSAERPLTTPPSQDSHE